MLTNVFGNCSRTVKVIIIGYGLIILPIVVFRIYRVQAHALIFKHLQNTTASMFTFWSLSEPNSINMTNSAQQLLSSNADDCGINDTDCQRKGMASALNKTEILLILNTTNANPLFNISNLIHDRITSMPNCDIGKLLMYKCRGLCGGWGDRQKGIVSTYLLSLLTNRTFIIDMPDPCPLESLLDGNRYDWLKCKPDISKFDANSTKSYLILDAAGARFARRLDANVTDIWRQFPVISIRTNAHFTNGIRNHPDVPERLPWILNRSNEEVIGMVLDNLFKPKKEIQDDIDQFFKEQVLGRHLVCSHVRFGRNPSNPKDSHLHWGSSYVTRILSFLDGYNDVGKYAIYIATDSLEVRERASLRFSNFISMNVSIMHVDQVPSGYKESCKGMHNVLLEQYILSKCDTLVLTRSNFGAMAAYIRGLSDNLYLNDDKYSKSIIKANSIEDIQQVFGFV